MEQMKYDDISRWATITKTTNLRGWSFKDILQHLGWYKNAPLNPKVQVPDMNIPSFSQWTPSYVSGHWHLYSKPSGTHSPFTHGSPSHGFTAWRRLVDKTI